MKNGITILLVVLNAFLAFLLWDRWHGEEAAVEAPVTESPEEPASASKAESGESELGSADAAGVEQDAKWEEFLSFLKEPETREAAKAHVEGRAAKNYGELVDALRLDGDSAQRLADLVSEKELALVEAYLETRSRSPEAISAALAKASDTYDRQIAEALGEEGYEAYEGYVKTLPLRRGVEKFEDYIRFSAEPLTSVQKEALVNVVREVKEAAGESFGGYPLLGQNWEDPDDRSVDRARTILSEGQMARYLDYLERNGSARRAMERQRERIGEQAERM